jgi:hypothetical protein
MGESLPIFDKNFKKGTKNESFRSSCTVMEPLEDNTRLYKQPQTDSKAVSG